jgi:hypothetical protein
VSPLLARGAVLLLLGVALLPVFVFLHQDMTGSGDEIDAGRPFRSMFSFRTEHATGIPDAAPPIDRWVKTLAASVLLLTTGAALVGAALIRGSEPNAGEIVRTLAKLSVFALIVGAAVGVLSFAFLEVLPDRAYDVALLAFVAAMAIYAWRRGPSLQWLRRSLAR